MAHPRGARSEGESPTAGRDRTVEPHRERRGKHYFFEIERGQKGQNPGPARTKARTKMWETVAGFVVEAEAPKITMPEHVEFVGNWEVDDVERTVVELN